MTSLPCMAKRRKEGAEEEELDFQIPKFDEEGFLKRERRNIKTMYLSFLFGLLIAVICFGFWVLMGENFLRWELVLLVAVVNSVWLRYLFLRLHIDLTDFGRKGWLSTFATYFMTWILLFIMLVNPPFYDAEPPHIEAVVLPGMQEPGGSILIVANVIDNVGVSSSGITFTVVSPNGTQMTPQFQYESNIFQYRFDNPQGLLGRFNYTLVVSDKNGLKTESHGSFIYADDVILLTTPVNGAQLLSYTPIELKVNGDVYTPLSFKIGNDVYADDFRVYYTVNNGNQINVSRQDENNREDYRTTAEYVGWHPGESVNFTAFVEVSYYFVNNPTPFNNTIRDTTTYQFTTNASDMKIGTKTDLIPPSHLYALHATQQPSNTLNYYLPVARSMPATPGFEVVVFVLALAVVLIVVKKRKKQKQT
jgi:hypothetical protein